MVNGHHGSVSMSVGQVLEFMAPFSPIYTTLLLSIGSVSGLFGSSDQCGLQAWGQMLIQPIGVIWGVVICESGLKIWATHVLSDMVIVNIFYKPNW